MCLGLWQLEYSHSSLCWYAEAEDEANKLEIEAKDGLESHCSVMCGTPNEEKLKNKAGEGDEKTIEKAVQNTLGWPEKKQQNEEEQFELKQKELESIANPVTKKMYREHREMGIQEFWQAARQVRERLPHRRPPPPQPPMLEDKAPHEALRDLLVGLRALFVRDPGKQGEWDDFCRSNVGAACGHPAMAPPMVIANFLVMHMRVGDYRSEAQWGQACEWQQTLAKIAAGDTASESEEEDGTSSDGDDSDDRD